MNHRKSKGSHKRYISTLHTQLKQNAAKFLKLKYPTYQEVQYGIDQITKESIHTLANLG